MKILMSSHRFVPSIGGTEEVSRILAGEFCTAGHEVQVVTQTLEESPDSFPFPIWRGSSLSSLLHLVRWCDVYFHNNISLAAAWPLLAVRRPWVIAHHTWLARTDGRQAWRDRWKQFAARFARNIAVSQSIADHLDVSSTVIGNPYRDELFRLDPAASRERELVFLGRLVSDKGLDILLQALAHLARGNRRPRLTVIGCGPEEAALRNLCSRLELDAQVTFAGAIAGPDLVAALNQHRILVVPSRWAEPFGLVALEGIACGCAVVGADGGGLPEAIGPCGQTFPAGDPVAMAESLREMIESGADLCRWQNEAPAHLAKHRAATVAARYLGVLEEAIRS